MIRRSILVALTTSILLFQTPAFAASVDDWRHDIDEIVHDFETVHPNAFTNISHSDLLAQAAALKQALPSLSEEQRMVRTMQLVALIGDGHTQLSPNRPDFAYWYPVRLLEFTDGYFVTAAYKPDADLVGAQVLEIGRQPVEIVMDRIRTLMNNENPLDRKEHVYPFHNAMLMKGLGYAASDGSLEVKFRLRDGKTIDRRLAPHRANDPRYREDDSTLDWRFVSEVYGPPFGNLEDWTTAYKGLPTSAYRHVDETRPPHFIFRRPFVAHAIPEKNAYYIQLNSVGDWGDKGFDQFFRNALAEVDNQKPRYLIIDIRYNAGGDGSKVPPVIHEFIKREDNPPWKYLYILTGRKTFSAADMVLAAFIDNTRCSIIGEPAGEPLHAYGDPTTIDLPRVGLELDVSTVWHQLSEAGDHSLMMPVDVPAPFSFTDYAAGRDPAVDAILRGDEMRSLPIIALEDGGAAARKVFEKRKHHFAQYAAWMHTREGDLLHAFWKLNDNNRQADALEIAKIMIELYPNSAMSWSKLGDAQIGLGRKAEGLKSYKRSLELDPNNLDNIGQRQAIEQKGFSKPDDIRFGATLAQMQTLLGNDCKSSNTREINPPFLHNVKTRQMQIDCEGFDFQGKPRHAEFVFGDDVLMMVWIIVTPEERTPIEQAMTSVYGKPNQHNAKYLAYTQKHAALRLDRSEALFYAPELESYFSSDFVTSALKP